MPVLGREDDPLGRFINTTGLTRDELIAEVERLRKALRLAAGERGRSPEYYLTMVRKGGS